jgi:hypothetical protein
MLRVKYFALLGISYMLSSCTAPVAPKPTAAPLSPQQVGVVVQGATPEQIEELCKPTRETKCQVPVSCRMLNRERGLVEIFGRSEKYVLSKLPQSRINKNIYFKAITKSKLQTKDSNLISKASEFISECEVPKTDPQTHEKLNGQIEILNHLDLVKNPLLDLKDISTPTLIRAVAKISNTAQIPESPETDLSQTEVDECSQESEPVTPELSNVSNENSQKKLSYLWMITTPQSSEPSQIQFEKEAQFLTDIPGEYKMDLYLKNEIKECIQVSFTFGGTYKEPFVQQATLPRPLSTAELTQEFPHLLDTKVFENPMNITGKAVKVAVIDSGINYNHEDLNQNILINQKEIAGNNLDDDNNGFIDDVIGWDFVTTSPLPLDDTSHGTHVAGLIASARMGLAPKAFILPLKVVNAMGDADLASTAAAVFYAIDQKVDIINISLGTSDSKAARAILDPALKAAEKAGILVTVAAGNGDTATGNGKDNDRVGDYPANAPFSNILTVAALGLDGELADYSNFGSKTVHVATYGGDDEDGGLNSTYFLPTKRLYTRKMGTSMAAPIAAGFAALNKELKPTANALTLKEILRHSSTEELKLKDKLIWGSALKQFNSN